MNASILSLGMISFLLSTLVSINAKAEVKDPIKLEYTYDALRRDGLDPKQWFLIEEPTLRDLYKSSEALPICETSLTTSQDKAYSLAEMLNDANTATWAVSNELEKERGRVRELENPAWYASVPFWGIAGVAVGFVSASVGFVFLSR